MATTGSVSGGSYPRRAKRKSTTFAPTTTEGNLGTTTYVRSIKTYDDQDGTRAEVVERDGVLRCSCINYLDKSWCNHLQHCITTSLDAMPNGTPESAHVEFVKYPDQMLIPMFPTKGSRDSGFQVVLIGAVENDGSREVRLADCMNELGDPELMGWIFAGEGRYVIRQTILEWIRSKYRTAPSCKSPVHKDYHWSEGDKRTDPLETRQMLDLFMLIKFSECSSCHQFSDPLADAPDL